jgi:cellulose synthase/poly-beta-1,6-N-acetylglucosamine synthase-like glycosyltransferase
MSRNASKKWNLKLGYSKKPTITILVPTYNEEKTINLKLENLFRLKYPKDLIQIILIDSASTDNTVKEAQKFVASHSEMHIKIIQEEKRRGKSHALNLALRHSNGDIIVVSDADCFWPSNILDKAIPYLADPTIGAVAGQEKLLNPNESWVTKTEAIYRDKMFQIQLGEAKLYSTIQFEGGFGAYKRVVLDEFDCETGSDDSGTALNIVQKKVRTIVVPEATFFTYFPADWKGKFGIKIRRAQQFLRIWLKCLKLLVKKELVLPKKIVLPQTFLFFLGPFIFVALVATTIVIMFQFPILVLPLVLVFVVPKSRMYLIEIIQNNLILLFALGSLATKRDYVVWHISKSSRKVDPDVLKERNLI